MQAHHGIHSERNSELFWCRGTGNWDIMCKTTTFIGAAVHEQSIVVLFEHTRSTLLSRKKNMICPDMPNTALLIKYINQ